MILTVGGIASVITTRGVLGILAAIPGMIIETIMDYKNVHNSIITCKYAYQSYQHLMIQIKTAKRKVGLGARKVKTKTTENQSRLKISWQVRLADELHKPIKRNFPKRRVIAHHVIEFWCSDLVDMQKQQRL